MTDQKDQIITDITEAFDPAYYRSEKPEDMETYGENFDGVEDTVIRMVLDAQKCERQ